METGFDLDRQRRLAAWLAASDGPQFAAENPWSRYLAYRHHPIPPFKIQDSRLPQKTMAATTTTGGRRCDIT
ncbi:hypothetical protein CGMCC3_g10749 [Colletotrichum fructicola]|nr:uncharacterized protein CGMCC3_g10749 [Colletotrichum fructicola]KAE9573215.1 hypothetical protein CGMCC3_g10749 [Colletotrichum fructicola]